MSRRRLSRDEQAKAEALFRPPDTPRATLWERQAHRWQTQSHDPATCPLCAAEEEEPA